MQLWLLTFFGGCNIANHREREGPSRGPELASPSCRVPAGKLWSSYSRCTGLQGPARVPCHGQHRLRSPQRAPRLLAWTRAALGEIPLHSHVLSTASYIGHIPVSVSINYIVPSQALRNYHVQTSLGAFGSVSVCSFLGGNGGKTMVCPFGQPVLRMCWAVCDGVGSFLAGSGWCCAAPSLLTWTLPLMGMSRSLEMAGEFLVISLKPNLAHDKDTDVTVLLLSNRADAQLHSQELCHKYLACHGARSVKLG